MRLIGMMDSPYVRRVAISLHLMEIAFTHEPVSVFRHRDAFAAINPVVKAPTLVLDDGTVLMDSTLILQHLDRLTTADRRLMPDDAPRQSRALRASGLALAACEKTAQIVYELSLRPAEKRHQPWLNRVSSQMRQAYRLLETETPAGEEWLVDGRPMQPDIDAAVAWRFTRDALAELSSENAPQAAAHPRLAAFAARAEALPAFRAAPPE